MRCVAAVKYSGTRKDGWVALCYYARSREGCMQIIESGAALCRVFRIVT